MLKTVKPNILFLYTEIAGYTLACLRNFISEFPETEIHLVRWPVNKEAPFDFSIGEKMKVYDRNSLDEMKLVQLAKQIHPDLILCSGWRDKSYLEICKKFRGKIPVVLAMDNKWEGTLKQRAAALLAKFSFLKNFSHAWVTGSGQKEFAIRLGFKPGKIRTGFYSADVDAFEPLFLQRKTSNAKRFIYAGRYYDFKGVNELWDAFMKLKRETKTGWELWCAGTGDVHPVESDGIRHFGFVQPDKMKELMKETSVFILPSRFEPWAVVVHEFAAAGFPLLLSDKVGAAEVFLGEGENGYSFHAGDVNDIYRVMKKIIEKDPATLNEMGKKSHELSKQLSPRTWAGTLNELLQDKPD